MTYNNEQIIPKREKKHNNNCAIEINGVSSLTGGRKWVLFKATVMNNKETISPGTEKSDTLSRPSAVYTGPALYCTARPQC